MKRHIFSILLLVAAILVAIFLLSFFVTKFSNSEEQTGPKIIIPVANSKSDIENLSEEQALLYSEIPPDTKLNLSPEESMIANFSIDFDDDGTEDLVLAIKTKQEQAISIVPMHRSPITGDYERQEAFKTAITQSKTLSLYAMDLIGEHKTSLICAGMDQANDQVMLVLFPRTTSSGVILSVIGDFRADSDIKIAESERSEAYNLLQTTGISFPIIVQSSDPEAPQTLDQIQKIYTWNRVSGNYELSKETKIPGKKIEDQYLSQLKNLKGTEFENFLDGLWYKTSTEGNSEPKYLLISQQDREIIFFDANQEVYSWSSSTPIRYGLYIIANNKSITTLKRHIDIKLSGIDEITVRISEDVKLKIMVESVWNGTYKKIPSNSSEALKISGKKKDTSSIITVEKPWKGTDGSELVIKANSYIKTIGKNTETGSVMHSTIRGNPIIQIRTPQKESKAYTYTIHSLKNNKKSVDEDSESIELIPVKLTAKGIEISETEREFFTR